ncbi:glycosyltransferase [Desulfobulbus sp. AH-315-M07]|nr:glycosyltransferase [Desulfobulbus sp. AH-315-M07]
MTTLLIILYFAVILTLSTYGLHRFHLVLLCRKHADRIAAAPEHAGPPMADSELPIVTIQLPLFNESTVVVPLIEYVAKMDYPRDKLEIQVLDDSIDETRGLARAKVEELVRRGFDAVYIHRVDRVGYKAGALAKGMKTCRGELIAVFDADFVPRPDFVRALVGHFRDPKVAMVQARWAHLNRESSILTRIQALMLDGHHLVENRARYGAGMLFNFSGTGGMWRKDAIEDAGGWQHDTLTEDLDLSYRAQLRGWKFIYRQDVVSPAELPEDMSALRAQQYRWAKGTVQTALKLMRRVMRSDLTVGQRVEAFFHLTPHFAYPLMVLLTLLLLPVLLTVDASDVHKMLLYDAPLCLAPITSLAGFYILAERAQGRKASDALKMLPVLIALGAGLAPHLTSAVWDGLRRKAGEFVRTPKRGTDRWRYASATQIPMFELALGLLSATSVVVSIASGHWFATPFATLFMLGYFYVSYLIVAEQVARQRHVVVAETTTLSSEGVAESGAVPAPTASKRSIVTELAA